MTYAEILNIVSMVLQLMAAVFCRYLMTFMPHSIFYCIKQAVVDKDRTWLNWLMKNIHYLGYSILSLALVATCLIMAVGFVNRDTFKRAPAQIFVNPWIWISVLLILMGHYLYIKDNLKADGRLKHRILN